MRYRLFALVLILFGATIASYAQQTTGSVRGSVVDSSGGALPNATVTATNVDSGVLVKNRTERSGDYSFPLLPPGHYRVVAQAKDFGDSVHDNVLVRITETSMVNFILKPGSVSQSIVVTDTPSMLQTNSSSEGKVIERQTIEALPLSTRNFTQLLGLTPGVLVSPFNAENIGFGTVMQNVNGMHQGSNNFLLDGTVNNNPMNDAAQGIGVPSVDFLQEFKVITSGYDAQYGRNAGSVVDVVTRSGSNALHGSFYEFLRNNVLVARPFFAARRGQNTQNQFGATIGGPVILPKLYNGKDRTFFFFGYEGLRQRNTNSNSAIVIGRVPTPAERQGMFTSAVNDPLTGRPFLNNTIPASRINLTAAQLLQQFVPLPNASGANNFVQQFGTPFNAYQFLYRIDQVIGQNDRLMFRHFAQYADQFAAGGRLPGFGTNQTFTNRQLVLSETHIFSPNLFNEFRFQYYNYINPSTYANTTDPTTVGIQPISSQSGLPGVNVTGFLPYGLSGGNSYKDQISAFLFNDSISQTYKSHTFTYGGEIRYAQEQSFGIPYQGRFSFNGQYTGNAFADFLIGGAQSATDANGPGKVDLREHNYGLFFQDNWKVSQRLTVNVGIRYEYNQPITDTLLGTLTNFYPRLYQGPGAVNNGLVTGGVTPGVPEATVHGDAKNFAPRVGFAYTLGPESRTVIRAGIGIFFDTPSGQLTQNNLFMPPYSAGQTVVRSATGPLSGFVLPPAVNLSLPIQTVPGGSLAIYALPEYQGTGYAEQGNFGIQHQMKNGLLLNVAYVGTRGLHQSQQHNINYPRQVGGSYVRPYNGFSYIYLQDNGARSQYDSLQISAQKRFNKGGTFLAAYTFGKAFDETNESGRFLTTAAGDPANLRAGRALASFNRPHRLVISYDLPLPNPFPGRARAVDLILGGWDFSGMTTFESGTPFSVTNAQSNLDRDGDAGSPGTGSWADLSGGHPLVNDGPNSSKLRNYINASAFAAAPSNRVGTAGRNILTGPGANLWDVRFSKTIPLKRELNALFLTEMYNVWNHPAFANPSSVLGTPTFGTITSTLSNARIIQFGVKVQY